VNSERFDQYTVLNLISPCEILSVSRTMASASSRTGTPSSTQVWKVSDKNAQKNGTHKAIFYRQLNAPPSVGAQAWLARAGRRNAAA
jgi:hypothetical protein